MQSAPSNSPNHTNPKTNANPPNETPKVTPTEAKTPPIDIMVPLLPGACSRNRLCPPVTEKPPTKVATNEKNKALKASGIRTIEPINTPLLNQEQTTKRLRPTRFTNRPPIKLPNEYTKVTAIVIMATTCTSKKYCFLQKVAAKNDQTAPAAISILPTKQAAADLLSMTALKLAEKECPGASSFFCLLGTKKKAKNNATNAIGNTYHVRYERQPPRLAA